MALGVGATDHTWPSTKYQKDPEAFFHDVLAVEPWSRQLDVIEAVRDNPRVAVSSGHKVSKSHTAAGLALWFYSSFEDARVVMSSTTDRQVNAILWRELRKLKARGERETGIPITGDLAQLARSGLKSADFREVVGFTAKEAEAVAGISGANLLYILDEASGIPEAIFEAIEGNRAGGARVVMFSNPTRTSGEFFEAFHSKSRFYKTITISSEETPNVVEGREIIPGLATRAWIDEKREEWGEDSPLYRVRVKGEFVATEDGKIISLHDIRSAEERWYDTEGVGRLYIGIDPAGPGQGGDETAFSIRRGYKQLALHAFRSLTAEAILAQLLGMIREHRLPRELPPVVVLDREGTVGSEVYGVFRAHLGNNRDVPPFEMLALRASDNAHRQGHLYDRMRDELWANLADWFKGGGAIVEDTKLAAELHAPEWFQPVGREKLKATSKKDLKKILKRSPDRADALALSVWAKPVATLEHTRGTSDDIDDNDAPAVDARSGSISPYGGRGAVNPWGRRS